ncbi:MAG: Fur family transcriptional regulator [Anaerolineae bacterium]
MEDVVKTCERRLRRSGIRITSQRRLVLDILSRAEDHLDANDIYEQGRRRDQCLSLSTVYRTLGIFKETGVVRELHLDGEQHHYELAGRDEHAHLVCLECGRVIEVESAAFARAAETVGQAHGFQVAMAQVELAGYCVDCQRRLEDDTGDAG